jgi:hypothetical protein
LVGANVQVRGTHQELLDAQGQSVKLPVKQNRTGTSTTNGNSSLSATRRQHRRSGRR